MAIDMAHSAERKAQLGQFFTPPAIAAFMARLFTAMTEDTCRLLDAGAGIGSLSDAFLRRWLAGGIDCQRVEVDAFEIDEMLHAKLVDMLGNYRQYPAVSIRIRGEDFIDAASDWLSGSLFASPLPTYTHAILNPPYKKIRSDSGHRAALRRAGIETVNLYTAFVALALDLLADHGQLVAIIPRSFCNGPYYKPFREFILQRAALRRMHLFASRTTAFKHDDVLQENIVILLERGGMQGLVTVSLSTDDTFSDLASHDYPFDQIVLPDDPERFIHVPTSPEQGALAQSIAVRYSLDDLGIAVSTGPVVDFRVQAHLRALPEPDTAPLLYPAHFSGAAPAWPAAGKKPNAIQRNADTDKWLYPTGFYCVVRRFSSKEERRRVVASVVEPALFGDATMLGFENHLNVFHDDKRGLPEALARGLAVYLNTTAVDEQFRRFNGHTQVNATDLRTIKYPSREKVIELGEWAVQQDHLTQALIDDKLESMTA
jgi:adenine-specific DNA-methyltransferase